MLHNIGGGRERRSFHTQFWVWFVLFVVYPTVTVKFRTTINALAAPFIWFVTECVVGSSLNMKRKCKQCWSTNQPISTKRTITYSINSLNTKRPRHNIGNPCPSTKMVWSKPVNGTQPSSYSFLLYHAICLLKWLY